MVTKEYMKQWREKHPNYDNEWRNNHPEYRSRHNAERREFYRKHITQQRESHRKYRSLHKKAYNDAHKIVGLQKCAYVYLLQHPELLGNECELCESTENLVGHHPDYSYPEVIVTLCASCHISFHVGED